MTVDERVEFEAWKKWLLAPPRQSVSSLLMTREQWLETLCWCEISDCSDDELPLYTLVWMIVFIQFALGVESGTAG